MHTARPGIFVDGSFGVGKSTVLDHLGDVFAAAREPFSLFDVDWFHRSWPTAADDERNVGVEARNMAAVWQNYRTAGERTPIIAGVVTGSTDAERYERVFGCALWFVELTASPAVAEQRLRGRYDADRGDALAWHLSRHEQAAADVARFSHALRVDTDRRTPAETAALIHHRFRRAHPAAPGVSAPSERR